MLRSGNIEAVFTPNRPGENGALADLKQVTFSGREGPRYLDVPQHEDFGIGLAIKWDAQRSPDRTPSAVTAYYKFGAYLLLISILMAHQRGNGMVVLENVEEFNTPFHQPA
jgi:hypothetical protein